MHPRRGGSPVAVPEGFGTGQDLEGTKRAQASAHPLLVPSEPLLLPPGTRIAPQLGCLCFKTPG